MYKIEKVDNNYYLLSEEEAYPYAFHIKNREVLIVDGVGEISGEIFHNKGFSYKDECLKVVATTDKNLLLPTLDISNI